MRDCDVSELAAEAGVFGAALSVIKRRLESEQLVWYPYDTLANLHHLDRLLTGEWRRLAHLVDGCYVADIGGGDGDLAFFLESLGASVDFIDHAPTNFNGLAGVRALKRELRSSVEVFEVDLDARSPLPRERYGLVLFLGTLYHLKSPFSVLERLADATRYCLLSTKVARWDPAHSVSLASAPVAYLLGPDEANNDPTNYWVFSEMGLRRILQRTGWVVHGFMTAGNTIASDPATPEGDERAFCLLESESHRARVDQRA